MRIGVEIHAQIRSLRKLFSSSTYSASLVHSLQPNSSQCLALLDVAMPGALPVLNKEAIELGIRAGLGLNCKINRRFSFDRKHYSYRDMPLGYQITQKFHPIASEGFVQLKNKRIRVQQLQLEQDSGRSIEQDEKIVVDLNRAGAGLFEIVTEPDLESAEDVVEFIKCIQDILTKLECSDASMGDGSLRVDVNVSVADGRCELKNLRGNKMIKKAIKAEIERQRAIIDAGGIVSKSTRRLSKDGKTTEEIRVKESSEDYRYLPDPDLPEFVIDDEILMRCEAFVTMRLGAGH